MIDFDELNILNLKTEDRKKNRDAFIDYLIDAYVDGFATASGMLGIESEIDEKRISESINKTYDGKSILDTMETYAEDGDEESMRKLLETEVNRAFNEGGLDSAMQCPTRVRKTWNTMLDNKVRENHSFLEGMTIDIDAEFYTPDGDHSLYPCGFQKAKNNVNCRCICTFTTEKE